jgi:hypothetical protein
MLPIERQDRNGAAIGSRPATLPPPRCLPLAQSPSVQPPAAGAACQPRCLTPEPIRLAGMLSADRCGSPCGTRRLGPSRGRGRLLGQLVGEPAVALEAALVEPAGVDGRLDRTAGLQPVRAVAEAASRPARRSRRTCRRRPSSASQRPISRMPGVSSISAPPGSGTARGAWWCDGRGRRPRGSPRGHQLLAGQAVEKRRLADAGRADQRKRLTGTNQGASARRPSPYASSRRRPEFAARAASRAHGRPVLDEIVLGQQQTGSAPDSRAMATYRSRRRGLRSALSEVAMKSVSTFAAMVCAPTRDPAALRGTRSGAAGQRRCAPPPPFGTDAGNPVADGRQFAHRAPNGEAVPVSEADHSPYSPATQPGAPVLGDDPGRPDLPSAKRREGGRPSVVPAPRLERVGKGRLQVAAGARIGFPCRVPSPARPASGARSHIHQPTLLSLPVRLA